MSTPRLDEDIRPLSEFRAEGGFHKAYSRDAAADGLDPARAWCRGLNGCP